MLCQCKGVDFKWVDLPGDETHFCCLYAIRVCISNMVEGAGCGLAKILGLAIHGQAERGGAPGPVCVCTTGHYSADGHWLMDVSAY